MMSSFCSTTGICRNIFSWKYVFPFLTTIWPEENSTSLTLSRRHSMSLSPQPYNKRPINKCIPDKLAKTICVSFCVRTTGRYFGLLALIASIIPSSFLITYLYKKTKALRTWFWVDALTCWLTAKKLRNDLTSSIF